MNVVYGWSQDFTFHYASTISTHPKRYEYVMGGFTFHYASTISKAFFSASFSSLTLHSTMLLLYLSSNMSQSKSTSLYIPLCFYYILYEIHRVNYFTILYIPLCFYYIVGRFELSNYQYAFTFHYASTISQLTYLRRIVRVYFTFHYASTISGWGRRRSRPLLYFTFHYASTISLS